MPSGRSIEAGRAVLKLLLDDKELNKKFADLQRSTRNIGRSITSTGVQIGAIGGAITAPLALATQQFIKAGDELNKMAGRTGVAVEALSELKFAAEQSGSNLQAVEKSVRTMQRVLLDAEQGMATATDTLAALGLQLSDIQGQNPEKQFELIVRRLAEVEDPTRRAAIAMEIFGRSGQQLLPMIDNMDALRQEARDLGITIDEETAQSAADLADAFNRVTKTVVGLAVQVGAALAPTLIELATILQEAIRWAIDFIRANQGLVTVLGIVGGSLTAVGATLVAVGGVVTLTSVGIGGLTKVIHGLRVALTLLATHPILAILTAIGAAVLYVTDGFGLWAETLDEATEKTGKLSAAQEAQKLQKQLEAQAQSFSQSAASSAPQPTQTDPRLLKVQESALRTLEDILYELRQGAGFIAGAS